MGDPLEYEDKMKQRIKMTVVFFLLLAVDQITKIAALQGLKPGGPIVLVPDVLELYYVENRGAAFGILQNKQWIFLVITLVVLVTFLFLIPKIPKDRKFYPLRVCLYFVGTGAVGNMIDRIFRGFVVDFIYFKWIDFPVFNVADIYVTVFAFLLVFLVIFYYKEEDLEKIFPKRK